VRIWIDACQAGAGFSIYSMTLLERQLRCILSFETDLTRLENAGRKLGAVVQAVRETRKIAEARIRPSEIWIELPEGVSAPADIPADLIDALPIRWMNQSGSVRERLQRALIEADGEPLLAFAGDTVVDPRIVERLAWWTGGNAVYIGEDAAEPEAAMRLEEPLPAAFESENELLEIGQAAVQIGFAKRLYPEDVDSYINTLRRSVPPYLFRITNEKACQEAARFLFSANYKGSTDFLTKWVYPPLVWAMVKPLAARRISPNFVTSVGITACVLSIPFFAAGMWVPGLILAYIMSVLDSVDGKLARVTFQASPQGEVLDHATDIIHPPFWYMAWAWGLSGGSVSSGLFLAALWMTAAYILDRVMEVLFRACTGYSIHGFSSFDAKMRTVISRRNVNLAIFTVALPLGLGEPAFYFMAGWQVFCMVFHLSRVVRYWNVRNEDRGSSEPFSPPPPQPLLRH